MDGDNDEVLMAQVARGDAAAFRRLAARSLPVALRVARGLLRSGHDADAEDVVQDALLRVWINAPSWRPERPFRAWLYRIVVNLCSNRRRRRPFVALSAVDDPPDPATDALARIEAREAEHRLAAAIAALPEPQRIAIVLTYQEGLDNAALAAAMDRSVSAVEALLVRARRNLRVTLQTDIDGS